MDVSEREYKAVCPNCNTDFYARIIMLKQNKRRYFCRQCCCEFEISDKGTAVYTLLKDGHTFKEREIKK